MNMGFLNEKKSIIFLRITDEKFRRINTPENGNSDYNHANIIELLKYSRQCGTLTLVQHSHDNEPVLQVQ